MTTPHRTLREAAQMALDALLTGYHQGTQDAITALREALSAPEPEPVAWCELTPNGSIAYFDGKPMVMCGPVGNECHTTPLYAAPPAAPADDHATPSGGQEAGPQEDRIEAAYWRFDARHKGYSQWKTAPMSERDAFKAEMRNALEAEKVRAEMRLVARGWRRPDAPAAPASQWMPIDTAPKDGTLFLCWVAAVRCGETDEGRQYEEDVSQLDFCYWRTQSDTPDGGWFDPCCGQIGDQQRVTHWMPLPAAPDDLRDVAEKVGPAAPPAAPAPAAPVPDGWVMVPKEATREMCVAAVVLNNGNAVYKNVAAEALEIEEQIYGEVWIAMIAASPAAPVVREPLRDDAFHAWVEEASADHPNLLERQEFRDAMYNAWINGYNTRVDEQANGVTGGSK